MSQQRKLMSRYSLLLLERFIVMTENNYQDRILIVTKFFCVATKGRGCKELYVVTGLFRVVIERCVHYGN